MMTTTTPVLTAADTIRYIAIGPDGIVYGMGLTEAAALKEAGDDDARGADGERLAPVLETMLVDAVTVAAVEAGHVDACKLPGITVTRRARGVRLDSAVGHCVIYP